MGVAREFLQSRDNIFYKGIKGLSVNVTHKCWTISAKMQLLLKAVAAKC